MNELLPLKNPELKAQYHVMEIYTEKEVYSEPFVMYDAATEQSDLQPKGVKPAETTELSCVQTPRHGDLATLWPLKDENSSFLKQYQPPLLYPF